MKVIEKQIKQTVNKGYYADKKGQVYSFTGKKLSQVDDGRGYLAFTASIPRGHREKIRVHKLQAYQKFGEKIFQKGIQVRHLNNDKKDNSWENIAIGNQSDNQNDIDSKELSKRSKKISPNKLSDKEALSIRKRVENNDYDSYASLAKEYNLKSKGSIHYIVHERKINL